jgi:hypothetical protein
MLTRRTVISAIACAAFAAPAPAADASAREFVAAIYDAYKGKNGNGVSLDNEKAIRRYFEPSLAALISKDQKDAARRNEAPKLDGDPFVDAGDWDITTVNIDLADTTPGKASATVDFKNGDKPTTVVLDLVKIKNDWRISDITWRREGKTETLRGLFAQ